MKPQIPFLIGALLCLQGMANPTIPTTSSAGLWNLMGISAAHAAETAAQHYPCPMHPQIVTDRPGTCPICGMDLVPVSGGHDHTTPAPMTSGAPVVEITAENIQKMGVRTAKVTSGATTRSLSANGIVMANERRRFDIFGQVAGRVENLRSSAVGDKVTKGDLFYTLVSPELQTLQNDYIAAARGKLPDLAQATRQRMKLLGIDDKVIATLARTGEAYDKVPFTIPADGVISKLEIRNGHYLKAGDEIGTVQDLSSVWVEASVPEKDIAAIKEGDVATVTLNARQSTDAKVDYIYPTINAESRTGRVRLEVDNKNGMLRPASYAAVTFGNAATTDMLTVPTEAVLHGSNGDHVIVALGSGKFQSRQIKIGTTTNGRTEIISGLQEGDDVAISSQFLIDSESSLLESLNKITGSKNAP